MLRLAIACSVLLAATVPVSAEQYISLAVSGQQSGADQGPPAFGIGVGKTQALAVEDAMKLCQQYKGKSCQIVENQKGGCFAVAKASSAPHDGIGIEATEKAAVNEAMTNCKKGGQFSGCSITNSACLD